MFKEDQELDRVLDKDYFKLIKIMKSLKLNKSRKLRYRKLKMSFIMKKDKKDTPKKCLKVKEDQEDIMKEFNRINGLHLIALKMVIMENGGKECILNI